LTVREALFIRLFHFLLASEEEPSNPSITRFQSTCFITIMKKECISCEGHDFRQEIVFEVKQRNQLVEYNNLHKDINIKILYYIFPKVVI